MTIFSKTGLESECLRDIRLGMTDQSHDAIVYFRNILLDPLYLDMVLYLFNSARYNSITYKMQSYVWFRATRTSVDFQTVYGSMLPLVETYNISHEVQKSYWCELQIQSDVTPHSPIHKTDVYNISKLRSSVYTSLQTHAVQHIDIITRPKEISIFRLGGWPSDVIRDNLTTAAVETCLLTGFAASSFPEKDAFEWGVHEYFDFSNTMVGIMQVTRIWMRGVFCPSSSQVMCMRSYIGALDTERGVQCIASVDVLFTSHHNDLAFLTPEQYMKPLQHYDIDMKLTQKSPCVEIVYLQHTTFSNEYSAVMNKKKELAALHASYHIGQLSSRILFDSGIHSLGIYNVTLSLSSHSTSMGLSLAAVDAVTSTFLQKKREQNSHIIRALGVLGVVYPRDRLFQAQVMNLRALAPLSAVDNTTNRSDLLVFSLGGGVLSSREIQVLVNSTIRFTPPFTVTSSAEPLDMNTTISGRLSYENMSFATAWRVKQVLHQYQEYLDPPPANSSEILFEMITMQSFTIPASLVMECGVVQESFAARIVSSSYTLRVSVTIPVSVVSLNPLLLEVLKSVIFKKTILDTIVLSSVSQQPVQNASTSEAYAESYSVVVYEIDVVFLQDCLLERYSNSEEFYVELGTVISGMFGVNIAIEMNAVCVVSNALTFRIAASELAATETCDSMQDKYNLSYSNHVFFANPDIFYTESCLLNADFDVYAKFNHVRDPFPYHHVLELQTNMSAGSSVKSTLSTAVQASFRLPGYSSAQIAKFVRVFHDIYNPVNTSDANALNVSVALNTSTKISDSNRMSILAMFSLRNPGLSANEKAQCLQRTNTLIHQTNMLRVACQQNVSVLWPDNSCIEIRALNTRMDPRVVRAYIFSKTTSDMIMPTESAFTNSLHAYVQNFPCKAHSLDMIEAFVIYSTNSVSFDTHPKHTSHIVISILHTTPFSVISEYSTNLVELIQDATKHQIDAQELLLTSNVVLHLYTQGVSHETALAFFESMMQEYVNTQLPPPATGRLRLQVTEIRQIQQYHSSFPDILFEEHNSNVPQLYIRVNILNLDSCSHIQALLDQSVIEKNMLGMQMLVRVVDTPSTPVTCTRTMKMAYTNEKCGAPAINSAELLGRMALGGTIIASNASCTVENEDCVAELTSSDTGIFYDVLQIISTQVDPLSFSFTHSVVVCGVDVALLAPAITIETMQVFGNNHFCPFPISLAKF